MKGRIDNADQETDGLGQCRDGSTWLVVVMKGPLTMASQIEQDACGGGEVGR